MRKIFPLIVLAFLTYGTGLPLRAQTTVAPFLTSQPQFLNGSGAPLNAGCVFTFAAGTSTPLVTYSDSAGSVPNANPVILNASGFPSSGGIWLTSAAYKFVVKSAGGVNCASGGTITTTDNITWVTPLTAFAGLTNTGDETLSQATAATSGANQSSNNLKVQGNYWTGAASAIDQWILQDVLGTGSNPTSTFTISHSGSPGLATFSIPAASVSLGGNLTLTGTLGVVGAVTNTSTTALNGDTTIATGKVLKFGTDTGLSRDSAGVVDVGNGTQGDTSGAFKSTRFTALANGGQSSSGFVAQATTTAAIGFNSSGGAADQKWADCFLNTTSFNCRFVNDANNAANAFMSVTRGAGAAVGAMTFGAGGGVQTLPTATDTLVGKATTDTLTNKTVTGTGSGNSITLLNSQDTLGAVTGTAGDNTLYTFTIPANTIQAGKGFRIRMHAISNNAVSCVYKLTIGSTTQSLFTSTGISNVTMQIEVFNNAGVQNAQRIIGFGFESTAILMNTTFTMAENFANALAVKITANEANPNTVTPDKWFMELIQ